MVTHPHFTGWTAVEGYTEHRSHRPGESVGVHCSGRVSHFDARVCRVGSESVEMWSASGIWVGEQAVPVDAWASGCSWPVTFEIETGADWPAGFYVVELRTDVNGGAGETDVGRAWFVLRQDEPRDRPLLVLSTNTWNAYNQWGGRCLYSGADAVSFRRPLEHGYLHREADKDGYDGRVGSIDSYDPEHLRLQRYQADGHYPLWTASSGWHNWERRFVAWAERQGVALDYAIDADLHRDANLLDGRSLLLTVGHSEYWSWEMRDHVDAYVEGGGNWAIFSGNTCFWQVRLDGDTMVCHKGGARFHDPVRKAADARLLTSMWSDPLIGRPENHTIGLSFSRGGYHRVGEAMPRGAGAYTIHRPDHWVLEGTGLVYGDLLGSGSYIVGYEVDGCAVMLEEGAPVPTGEDGTPDTMEIIGTAPARLLSITEDHCEAPEALWASTEPPGDLEGVALVLFGDASDDSVSRVARGRCVMGTFTKGRGVVFNAGSVDWAYGLDHDPLVQQVTGNVLARLGGSR